MEPLFDPDWGDRRQEIVFIGLQGMDQADLRAALDDCLVPETTFRPDHWRDLPDPFPSWEARPG
jgi:hypothetical protein